MTARVSNWGVRGSIGLGSLGMYFRQMRAFFALGCSFVVLSVVLLRGGSLVGRGIGLAIDASDAPSTPFPRRTIGDTSQSPRGAAVGDPVNIRMNDGDSVSGELDALPDTAVKVRAQAGRLHLIKMGAVERIAVVDDKDDNIGRRKKGRIWDGFWRGFGIGVVLDTPTIIALSNREPYTFY